MKKIALRALSVLLVIYILNPTFGVDLAPDNLPIVGNLDEALATYGVIAIEKYLKEQRDKNRKKKNDSMSKSKKS